MLLTEGTCHMVNTVATWSSPSLLYVACKLDNENWAGTGDEGIPTYCSTMSMLNAHKTYRQGLDSLAWGVQCPR